VSDKETVDKSNTLSIRDYVERIFAEKDKLAESQRETLERALVEARETTEKAMIEAKGTVEARLVEAKVAADAVQEGNVKRLDNLESGGAPFASRLDESQQVLKGDVSVLKENMVRTTVFDALRDQDMADAKQQKRAIRNLYITVGAATFLSLLSLASELLKGALG
jgi:predicted DNA-binding protein (UPF0251 family)